MDGCGTVWPLAERCLHGLVAHKFEWLCQSIEFLFIVLGVFNFGDIQGREGWERLYQNSFILVIQCLYD